MKRTRQNHGATFKAQVAWAAVKGDQTLAELAGQFLRSQMVYIRGAGQEGCHVITAGGQGEFQWHQGNPYRLKVGQAYTRGY